jgi:type IV secretion system protein VirB6
VSSLVLQLSARVAAALWSASIINTITGQGAEGFSTQALEQGGIGLLLTVLIISVPPMAAMFFQGTLGSFMPYAAVGAGAASRPGPQGQPPGSYGYGRNAPPSSTAQTVDPGGLASTGGFASNPGAVTRVSGASNSSHADVVRAAPASPPAGGSR